MNKIDLQMYKGTVVYFKIFDALINSKIEYPKDMFLESLKINPSSYRRARLTEQKIGKVILEKLSVEFQIGIPDDLLIDEIERLFNAAYDDISYKIYDHYQYYLQRVEELLSMNLAIHPILQLMRLLLIANSNKEPSKIIKENYGTYLKMKEYDSFFVGPVRKVLDLVTILYTDYIPNDILCRKYDDGLVYFVIASKSSLRNDFVTSLYYCDRAKKYLAEEENYIRMIYLNLTKMLNHNETMNYNATIELAESQMSMLKSLNMLNKEYEFTLGHYVLALLGSGRYQKVIDVVSDKKNATLTDVACMMIAKYKCGKAEYLHFYKNELGLSQMSQSQKSFLVSLANYLDTRNKKYILQLESARINRVLLKILKKL